MRFRFPAVAALCLSFLTPAFAFDLQGHRGARGLLPENTLPGFAKALDIGVTTLELDTGVTKDGVVVISHDPALNPDITRGPDGKWIAEPPVIKDTTFEDLKRFDVGRIKPGSRTQQRFADQKPIDGTTIPSLEDLFDMVEKSGNQTVRFNIETKINPLKPELTVSPSAFAKAVVDLVKAKGLQKRVTIQSFDWRTLQEVQKIAPQIDTVYLSIQHERFNTVRPVKGSASPWTAGFNLNDYNGDVAKMIEQAGGKVWSPFFRDLDQTKVKAAQALGLKVIPWTVNDEADMERLIDMQVDGIITDYPDRLRIVYERKQAKATPKSN